VFFFNGYYFEMRPQGDQIKVLIITISSAYYHHLKKLTVISPTHSTCYQFYANQNQVVCVILNSRRSQVISSIQNIN